MNSSNTDLKQGELVVADVLFAEQVGAKRRLALIISNSEYNKSSDDVVIVKVTSHGSNTEFDISLKNKDSVKSNLKKDSIIMVDFPMTLYKGNIYSIPDSINENKLNEVKNKVRELYNL